jgi:hypothetical protein
MLRIWNNILLSHFVFFVDNLEGATMFIQGYDTTSGSMEHLTLPDFKIKVWKFARSIQNQV